MSLSLADFVMTAYTGSVSNGSNVCEPMSAIRVDDRKKGEFCPDFCDILIPVMTRAKLLLVFHNLPLDNGVRDHLSRLGADVTADDQGNKVELWISANSARDSAKSLRWLATLVRRVVGPGREYAKRNWKWVAPRTADSLARFADVLDQFNIAFEATYNSDPSLADFARDHLAKLKSLTADLADFAERASNAPSNEISPKERFLLDLHGFLQQQFEQIK